MHRFKCHKIEICLAKWQYLMSLACILSVGRETTTRKKEERKKGVSRKGEGLCVCYRLPQSRIYVFVFFFFESLTSVAWIFLATDVFSRALWDARRSTNDFICLRIFSPFHQHANQRETNLEFLLPIFFFSFLLPLRRLLHHLLLILFLIVR